ncbi:MAG: hypothetical protein ABH865_00360 [Candidatus Omnitrophota bacterium]
MKRISECIGKELVWKPRHFFSNSYELFFDSEIIARLEVAWFRFSARAITADGEWRFQLKGFWQRKIIIVDSRANREVGQCSVSWLGRATFVTSSAQEFFWVWRGFLGLTHAWVSGGSDILLLRWKFSKTYVEFGQGADISRFSALLSCLGKYLLILEQSRNNNT